MLKYIFYGIAALMVLGLVVAGVHGCRVYFKNKKEMAPFAGAGAGTQKNLGRVLVVYYSLSGHTKEIAQKIQAQTNADIYEIKTKEPMPSGVSLYTASKKQIKDKDYPALEGPLPDFSKYDVIFVGAPVWWYTAATPALSFLEQADFKGKKVVPFSTQGSNPGTFEQDFKAAAKNAEVLRWEKFNNISEKYDSAVDNKISAWINGL